MRLSTLLAAAPFSAAIFAQALVAGSPQSSPPPSSSEDPRAEAPLELPPSAAADALARLGPSVAPKPLAAPAWPAWSQEGGAADAWSDPAPWERWAKLLADERAAPDAARRAELALLAAEQGRHLDAWEHFAAATAAPEAAADLLPRLFPGIPADAKAAPGGLAGELPDGVLLRPILPPLERNPEHGRPDVRSAAVRGLRIGAAVCDLEVRAEADGVEVSFAHRSGGAARVRLMMPQPADRTFRAFYVNWERLEEPPAVFELALEPGESGEGREASVWARFEPGFVPLPAAAKDELPALLARGGLRVEIDPGDPLERRYERLTEWLGALFEIETVLHRSGIDPEPARAEPASLLLSFPASLTPEERAAKWTFVLSAAERRFLGGR